MRVQIPKIYYYKELTFIDLSNTFQARYYQPGDDDAIIELLKGDFPAWDRQESPQDYLKWKHLEDPNGSLIVVAVSGEKIVGVDIPMLQKIKIGDLVYLTFFGAATVTHPEYRRMGISKVLGNLADGYYFEHGLKYNYSNSENPIVIRNNLKTRLLFPHKLIQMTRMNSTEHIDSTVKKYGFKILSGINKISNSVSFDSKNVNEFKIIQIDKFDEDINKFFNEAISYHNYIVVKDSTYLNWRYCDPRGGKHIIYKAAQDGVTLGFIVMELRKTHDGYNGTIAELLALPGKPEVARSLLRTSCKYFDDEGGNVLNYGVIKGHPYQNISKRFGFLDTSIISKMETIGRFKEIMNEYEKLKTVPPNKVYMNFGEAFLE